SSGSSLTITSLLTGQIVEGAIVDSDGEFLVVEPFRWWPKVGDELKLVKNFTAFDRMIRIRIEHYYRLLRTEVHVREIEEKLKGNSKPLELSLPHVQKIGRLDDSQINAFNQCIGDSAVTLIQGPPGTGKTTFAAE